LSPGKWSLWISVRRRASFILLNEVSNSNIFDGLFHLNTLQLAAEILELKISNMEKMINLKKEL